MFFFKQKSPHILIWSYNRCTESRFGLWILPDSNNYNVKSQNLKDNETETRYVWA